MTRNLEKSIGGILIAITGIAMTLGIAACGIERAVSAAESLPDAGSSDPAPLFVLPTRERGY